MSIIDKIHAAITKRGNIDHAISSITKAVERLDAAVDHHFDLADLHRNAAAVAQQAANDASVEGHRALKYASKIRDLIS